MATEVFLIPLDGINQSFEITLKDTTYNMTVKWNPSVDAGWVLDIADSENVPIIGNVPLITGADCLSGLEYLGIGGQLFVLTDQNVAAVPTFTNLGTDCNLYFQTEVANG